MLNSQAATVKADTPDPKQAGDMAVELPPKLALIGRDHTQRSALERFIGICFARRYGATLNHFMPTLLVLGSAERPEACLGLRRGVSGCPFFLEHYLDGSAEHLLSEALRRPVARESLVEIGNLVSLGGGRSQMLFVALTSLLCQIDAEWAIFTATPEVRKLLSRLKLTQFVLGEADGRRLGPALADWGSYYDGRPQVVAVHVRKARRALKASLLNRLRLINCEPQLRSLLAAQGVTL